MTYFDERELSLYRPKWGKVPEIGAWEVISPIEHSDLVVPSVFSGGRYDSDLNLRVCD